MIVAVPAIEPAIKEMVTTPLDSGVVTVAVVPPLEKVPRDVVKVTLVPVGTEEPALFNNVAVIAEELIPSAAKVDGLAARDMLEVASIADILALPLELVLSSPQETNSKRQKIKRQLNRLF